MMRRQARHFGNIAFVFQNHQSPVGADGVHPADSNVGGGDELGDFLAREGGDRFRFRFYFHAIFGFNFFHDKFFRQLNSRQNRMNFFALANNRQPISQICFLNITSLRFQNFGQINFLTDITFALHDFLFIRHQFFNNISRLMFILGDKHFKTMFLQIIHGDFQKFFPLVKIFLF